MEPMQVTSFNKLIRKKAFLNPRKGSEKADPRVRMIASFRIPFFLEEEKEATSYEWAEWFFFNRVKYKSILTKQSFYATEVFMQ